MKRPLVLVALGWIVGSGICEWLGGSTLFYFLLGLAVVGIGGWQYYQFRQGLLITLFLLGWALGAARLAYVHETSISQLDTIHLQPGWTVNVIGEIDSLPQIDGDRMMFDLHVKQVLLSHHQVRNVDETVKVTVRLLTETEWQRAHSWERSWQIQLPITLEKPSLARNPGAFDYATYLKRHQVYWLAKVDGLNQVQVLSMQNEQPLVWMDRLRQYLEGKMDMLYPAQYAGLMNGLVLGEQQAVDPTVMEEYSQLGIVHILSISGMNVSLFVAGVYFVLIRLGLTRERVALFVLLLLPFYAVLTGGAAPVVRAVLMSGLGLLAVVLRRWGDVLSFLALSLLLQLGWSPTQLFEVGFQLSYLVTAALLVATAPLAEKMVRIPWNWLREAIAATTVAQVVSFPILVWNFHQFSFLSWFANLLLVPIFSVVVFSLGMVALLVSLVTESVAKGIAQLSVWALDVAQWGVGAFIQWDGFARNWVSPSWWWMIVYGGLTIYAWVSWVGDLYHRRRHRTIATIGLIVWFIVAYQLHNWTRNEVKVTFVDVGQGDCTVIETMTGKVIIVDGGGTLPLPLAKWQIPRDPYDVGKRVVVPFLRSQGIQQIDVMVMTHADVDHIEGLQAVAESFPVKEVIRNPDPVHSRIEAKLMNTLANEGVPIYTVPKGTNWQIEPRVTWQFLYPDEHHLLGNQQGTNNDGVVFLLTAYSYRILMAADIEAPAEDLILQSWNLPHINLLKVAHHGSKTSTQEEWLDALQPDTAVISVGAHNHFGHPSSEVIQRLQAHHIQILRTDQNGAIILHLQPEHVWLETLNAE